MAPKVIKSTLSRSVMIHTTPHHSRFCIGRHFSVWTRATLIPFAGLVITMSYPGTKCSHVDDVLVTSYREPERTEVDIITSPRLNPTQYIRAMASQEEVGQVIAIVPVFSALLNLYCRVYQHLSVAAGAHSSKRMMLLFPSSRTWPNLAHLELPPSQGIFLRSQHHRLFCLQHLSQSFLVGI